ncbi:MAG TPA: outer membrane beta-barrel domain-containing protein [Kofleriaceae bacterium]|nr:outer membrane beta-barrel domain-containing protein [Kofleriaceae bacterium]
MRKLALGAPLSALLAIGWAPVGSAQPADDGDPVLTIEPDEAAQPEPEPGGEGEMTFDVNDAASAPEPEPEPEPDGGLGLSSDKPVDGNAKLDLGESRVSWEDILVVVRKPFLKVRRIELLPQVGITMNDAIIRHFQLGGQINYYMTDVLAVGVEGSLFQKDLREPFDVVARQDRRLPTVNKYNWEAALNFHYVPIYGKFAVLDNHILHWETFFTAGVGMTETEVVPRDPAYEPFKNHLITPNVGASMRFFLNKWLTVSVGIRDYIFIDKFESQKRGIKNMEVTAEEAKEGADSSLINNVMFQAGLSIWLPMSFEYTTFR